MCRASIGPGVGRLLRGGWSDRRRGLELQEAGIGLQVAFLVLVAIRPRTSSWELLVELAHQLRIGLDEAVARVAAQFAMPKVKSADAAAAGGGVRGV